MTSKLAMIKEEAKRKKSKQIHFTFDDIEDVSGKETESNPKREYKNKIRQGEIQVRLERLRPLLNGTGNPRNAAPWKVIASGCDFTWQYISDLANPNSADYKRVVTKRIQSLMDYLTVLETAYGIQ